MAKEMLTAIDMPEAKASATYSLRSPKGFDVLYTVRSMNSGDLFEEMDAIEQGLVDKGYTSKNGGGGKVNEDLGNCPKCNSPLVSFTTKSGKSGVKCSTQSYDFMSKSTIGCDYTKWDDDFDSEGATESQVKLLKDKGLWKEGMSKAEASKVIGEALGK